MARTWHAAQARAWLVRIGAGRYRRERRVQVGAGVLLLILLATAVAARGMGAHHRGLATAVHHLAALVTATPSHTMAPTGTATPIATRTAVPATRAPAPSTTPLPPSTTPLPPTLTVSSTRTPFPTGTPSDTPTEIPSATATKPPTSTPTPTIDPVYYAEDTLAGTGPGPAGPLSGLPTTPSRANRRPVAVVIDNFAPDARPQTGLNRASLVFETLVEGGITRLMAVYLERDAPVVGPVRSARIYFNAWADGLQAIYAHAGGNSDALYQLGHGLKDMANADDLNLPVAPNADDQPFWRSPDRVAPHNLYTATAPLRAYEQQAGHSIYGSFPAVLPHRVPDPYFHRPDTAWIDVGFSSYPYNVHWAYDRTTNTYLRSAGGLISADPLSRRQEAPSNVVVLFTRVTPDVDPFAPDGVNVHTQGTGRALYFRDGHLVIGSWHKRAMAGPLELLDPRGKPQLFNPGQTWIEVVPLGAPVTWRAP